MEKVIAYNPAVQAANNSAVTVTAGQEITLLTISNLDSLRKSQLSTYIKATLSTLTSIDIRYYCSDGSLLTGSTLWYQIPIKDVSTGELVDTPSKITSNSPAESAGVYQVVEDLPVSACVAIKITATGVGTGTGTVDSIRSLVRDN